MCVRAWRRARAPRASAGVMHAGSTSSSAATAATMAMPPCMVECSLTAAAGGRRRGERRQVAAAANGGGHWAHAADTGQLCCGRTTARLTAERATVCTACRDVHRMPGAGLREIAEAGSALTHFDPCRYKLLSANA